MTKPHGTAISSYFGHGEGRHTFVAKLGEGRSTSSGFKEESSQMIGVKRREIVELLKPYVLREIQKNNFSRAVDIQTHGLR
jgi:hypothetical protein